MSQWEPRKLTQSEENYSVLVNEKVVPVCLCRSSEGVDRKGLKKVLPTDHPYVANGKQTLIHSLFFQFIKIVFQVQTEEYFAADWRL